jgi:hypothetical protein
MEKFERDVKATFTTAENAGKIIITAREVEGALTFILPSALQIILPC